MGDGLPRPGESYVPSHAGSVVYFSVQDIESVLAERPNKAASASAQDEYRGVRFYRAPLKIPRGTGSRFTAMRGSSASGQAATILELACPRYRAAYRCKGFSGAGVRVAGGSAGENQRPPTVVYAFGIGRHIVPLNFSITPCAVGAERPQWSLIGQQRADPWPYRPRVGFHQKAFTSCRRIPEARRRW